MAGWSGILGRLAVVLGLDKKEYEADLKSAAASARTHTGRMQKNFDGISFKSMRRDWLQTTRILDFVGVGLAARMMYKEFDKTEGVIALKSSFQGLVDVWVKELTPAINMATGALARFLDLGEKGGPSAGLTAQQAYITTIERKISALKANKQWAAVAIQQKELALARGAFSTMAQGMSGVVNGQYAAPIGPIPPVDLAERIKKTDEAQREFERWKASSVFTAQPLPFFHHTKRAKETAAFNKEWGIKPVELRNLDLMIIEEDKAIDEMEQRWADFGGNVQASWASSMTGMMSGTLRFRDFTKEMFRSVEKAFFDMISRMAAQKFFDATLGKLAGSQGVTDMLKYRTAGSEIFR